MSGRLSLILTKVIFFGLIGRNLTDLPVKSYKGGSEYDSKWSK